MVTHPTFLHRLASYLGVRIKKGREEDVKEGEEEAHAAEHTDAHLWNQLTWFLY